MFDKKMKRFLSQRIRGVYDYALYIYILLTYLLTLLSEYCIN